MSSGGGKRRGRPPGGGRSPEEARARLLDAAEACFARDGIEHTTIEDVAAEAGLSRGMVYRHFEGRDDLLTGVLVRATDRFIAHLSESFDPDSSLADIIVDAMTSVVLLARSDPSLRSMLTPSDQERAGRAVSTSLEIRGRGRAFASQIFEHAGEGRVAEIRPGVTVEAAVDYLVMIGLALISGLDPVADDEAALRSWMATFVLPAIVVDPPPPAVTP